MKMWISFQCPIILLDGTIRFECILLWKSSKDASFFWKIRWLPLVIGHCLLHVFFQMFIICIFYKFPWIFFILFRKISIFQLDRFDSSFKSTITKKKIVLSIIGPSNKWTQRQNGIFNDWINEYFRLSQLVRCVHY